MSAAAIPSPDEFMKGSLPSEVPATIPGAADSGATPSPDEFMKGRSDYTQQENQKSLGQEAASGAGGVKTGNLGQKITSVGAIVEPAVTAAGDFVKGAWNQINPLPAARATIGAFGNPQEAVRQDLQRLTQPNSMEAHDKMVSSWRQGDYANAARHAVGWLVPYVGEDIDKLGDLAASGHLAEALGGAAALGGSLAGAPGVKAATAKTLDAVGALRPVEPLKARPGFQAPAPVKLNAPEVSGYMPSPAEAARAEKTAAEAATAKNVEEAKDLPSFLEAQKASAAQRATQAEMGAKAAFQKLNPAAQKLHLDNLLGQSANAMASGDWETANKLQGQYQSLSGIHQDVMAGINKATAYEAQQAAQAAAQQKQSSLLGRVGKIALPESVALSYPHGWPLSGAVHTAGHVIALTNLLRSGAGRAVLMRLGKMDLGSPGFQTMWNAAKAGAATSAVTNADVSNRPITLEPPTLPLPPLNQAQGGLITGRLPDRHAVLESLMRRSRS